MVDNFNQEVLQKILTGCPGMIYIFNLNSMSSEYTSVNTKELAGYSIEEVVAMGNQMLLRIIHPEDLDRLQTHLQLIKHKSSDETRSIDLRLIRKGSKPTDNDVQWFTSYHTPLDLNDKNEVVKICGVAIDITELKSTRSDLENKNWLLTNITSLNPAHIIITDAQTNMITFSNRTLEDTLGHTIIEEGKSVDLFNVIKRIMLPEDFEKVVNLWSALVNKNSSDFYQIEIRFYGLLQDFRWFNYVISPYKRDEEGKIKSIIHFAIDITQSKETKQKLEAKHADLEQFIYVSSHDLKQPLSTIISALSILKNELQNGDDQVVNKCLSMISDTTHSMKQNINSKLKKNDEFFSYP